MLPSIGYLKKNIAEWLISLNEQGYDISLCREKIKNLPDSYDAVISLAGDISKLPLKKDWAYREPINWDEIENEMDKKRKDVIAGKNDLKYSSQKVEAAFLASVLGCILGKPLEVAPTLAELKQAGMSCGEWPISDFISERFLDALGKRHASWTDTTKEKISYVAPDDDLHYTIMGMINLENYGLKLDLDGVKNTWLNHQCMNFVWGPERHIVSWIAVNHLFEDDDPEKHKPDGYYLKWSSIFNPGSELCGAAIRADAYGYAFPGRPDLAAKYAYIDASFTHRRTGVYSAMFIASAIALMFAVDDPLLAFEGALKFIPQRSRFFYNTKLCLDFVRNSSSFDEAYQRIHQRFSEYGHCKVYQEIGTLINTLRFAEGIWDGVCKQVMQGNDTDSFGCTAGSLLGAHFGLNMLPKDKLALFNDEIKVSLASFHEHSLSALAHRMGELPAKCIGSIM
jgi:ADP-ribosylglycohydrolase